MEGILRSVLTEAWARAVTAVPPGTDTAYRSLSLWHDTAGRGLDAPAGAARRHRRRRRDRRRRLHGPVDRVLPAAPRPVAARRWCSSRRSPASAPAGATAAGAPRCSRPRRSSCATGTAPDAPATCAWRCSTPSTRSAGSASAEGVDAHYVKGGTVVAARTPAPAAPRSGRGRSTPGARHRRGRPRAARPRRGPRRDSASPRVLGATYTPTARASIRPGWCGAWPGPSSGSAASSTSAPRHRAPGRPGRRRRTARVRAPYVLRATEGFTPRLPGAERAVAPVYSLMIATEPLPASFWASVGPGPVGDVLRPPAPDHLRPADRGRPAGLRRARGAVPLRLGHPAGYDRGPAVHAELERTLRELFPALEGHRVTHPGAARSASPATGWPRSCSTGTGLGGPAATSATASARPTSRAHPGRPRAGRDTARTRLPWVGHRRAWEPEPLRWLGINAGLRLTGATDLEERLTGRPARLGALLGKLTGGH